MTVSAKFELDNRFKQRVAARYGGYEFRAGVLQDKPYRAPLPASRGLSSLAGGPVRKQSRRLRGTVAGVGERIRKDLDVPYLSQPFLRRGSKEMRAFLKAFGEVVLGKVRARKFAEDALQEVIRAPLRKQRYGRNTAARAKVKRFNRRLFDTGQFYKAIIAKITRKSKNV